MTDVMLRLKEVTCDLEGGRGPVRALNEVSLTVAAGEMVAVMGPSGSGKSTLIHVADGGLTPTAGTVAINGQEPPRRAPAWWAEQRRRTLGVVHQRLNLVPSMRVIDNVALPLLLDGRSRDEAEGAAGLALTSVGAATLAAARPEEISVGEQQRVAIARAVVGPRHLVLADEPTAALDTVGAEQVIELLSRLASEGLAVLFTTHDSRLAAWADRVLFLRDGRLT